MKIHDIKLGYSCNNNCVHCVIAGNRAMLQHRSLPIDLTKEEVISLIDRAVRDGAMGVVLTGGEPTIRADFIDILLYCHRMVLPVEVQTNGRVLEDETLCLRIPTNQKIEFCVAIHGHTDRIHDTITQRSGSFRATVRGIENLLRRSFTVRGKVVISRYNSAHLKETLKLIHNVGVQFCNFAFPHALGNAWSHFDNVVPQYSEIQRSLNELLEEASRLDMQVDLETVPFCVVPHHIEAVAELKFLSNERRLFTQVREPTRDWGKVRPKNKKKVPECLKCCYFRICEGPWKEYLERFGGDELVPVQFDPTNFTKLIRRVVALQM